MKNAERTLVLIKPDAMQRSLAGEIISRFERRGLTMVAMKLLSVPRSLAEKHYEEHVGKPFYAGLVDYICSSPVIAMVWEGEGAVAAVRQTVGLTNPLEAAPGSIRADFGLAKGRNLVHASDTNPGSAEREVALWFGSDLVPWPREVDRWVYE